MAAPEVARRHRVRASARCRSAATCECSTSARTRCRATELDRAFNRKPLGQRAAIVAAGPIANLLLAILLYAGAHWIGIEEPKALLGAPVAGSIAERAGLRAGDWVRAVSHDGTQWDDLRSMTDLRWQLTQSALQGETVQLMVTDADDRERAPRDARPRRARLAGGRRAADAHVGLAAPYSEPVLGEVRAEGAAARAGLHAGDRVISVDGQAIADAGQLRERIRASVDGDTAPHDALDGAARCGDRCSCRSSPRWSRRASGASAASRPSSARRRQMVTVRYGPIEGLTQARVRRPGRCRR